MRSGAYTERALRDPDGQARKLIYPAAFNRTRGQAEVVLQHEGNRTRQLKDFTTVGEARTWAYSKLAELYQAGWTEDNGEAPQEPEAWTLIDWSVWPEEEDRSFSSHESGGRSVRVPGRRTWHARGQFLGSVPLRNGDEFQLSAYGATNVDGVFMVTAMNREIPADGGEVITEVEAVGVGRVEEIEPQQRQLWTPEMEARARPTHTMLTGAWQINQEEFERTMMQVQESSIVSIPANDVTAATSASTSASGALSRDEIVAFAERIATGSAMDQILDELRARGFSPAESARFSMQIIGAVQEIQAVLDARADPRGDPADRTPPAWAQSSRSSGSTLPDRLGAPEPMGLFSSMGIPPDLLEDEPRPAPEPAEPEDPDLDQLEEQDRIVDLDE